MSESARNRLLCRLGLVAVLLFSLALGFAAVFEYRQSPFFAVPLLDEAAHLKWARGILAGEPGREFIYYDPLYSYWLAFWFRAFGEKLLLVRAAQVIAGTAAVLFIFLAGRRLAGEAGGLAAAVLLALSPSLYFFELLLLKESLLMFFTTASLFLGVAAAEKSEKPAYWIPAGMSLGVLVFLRGNFITVSPLLAASAFFMGGSRRPIKKRLAGPAAAFLGLLLVLGPMMALRGRETGSFPRLWGFNFYIGNYENATGSYSPPSFVRARPIGDAQDFELKARERTGRNLTPAETSSYWFHQGLDWIRENPAAAALLWARKLLLLLNNYEIPNNQSLYLLREMFVPALKAPRLGFGLIWGPAIMGILILTRRKQSAWFPALFGVLYAASLLPFFIVARYRVPLVPVAALFAGAFIIWLARQIRLGKKKAVAGSVVFLAFCWGVGFIPLPEVKQYNGNAYFLLGDAYFEQGKTGEALVWFQRARDGLPRPEQAKEAWLSAVERVKAEDAEALFSCAKKEGLTGEEVFLAGEKLEELGFSGKARELYELALKRTPDFYPAHLQLARIYAAEKSEKAARKALFHLEAAARLQPLFKQSDEYAKLRQAIIGRIEGTASGEPREESR